MSEPVSVDAEQMFDEFYEDTSGTQLPRDRWGRPLIAPSDGGEPVPYTRVSTLAQMLDDKHGIHTWELRLLARGLGHRQDLVDLLAAIDPITGVPAYDRITNAEIDVIIERALDFAGRDVAADYGTAIHKLTEPGGRRVGIRTQMANDLAAFDHAMAGAVPVLVEQFVVNDKVRAAGTFDGTWRFAGIGHVLGDKKTGDYHPLAVTVQLTTYRGGKMYDAATGEREDLPDDLRDDIAFTIHAPLGRATCDVYQVDLGLGRELVALAGEVRDHRAWATKKSGVKLSQPVDVRKAAAAHWIGMIHGTTNREELAALMARAPRIEEVAHAANLWWASFA